MCSQGRVLKANALDGGQGRRQVRVEENDDELLSPITTGNVARPHSVTQNLLERFEHLVTGRPPVSVVAVFIGPPDGALPATSLGRAGSDRCRCSLRGRAQI